MTSKSVSWRQRVCYDVKICHDVKKIAMMSINTSYDRQKYVIISNFKKWSCQNMSWCVKVCHKVKHTSGRQNVHHDIKKCFMVRRAWWFSRLKLFPFSHIVSHDTSWHQKYVMASKICHDIKNMLWRQKVHEIKNTLWPQKVRNNVKNLPWRQKVRHDVKKVRHDIKNTSWHKKVCHIVKNAKKSLIWR